ncbi:hypothetical protein [Cryptosporangium aurantiacum]|uniref:ATP/GTP-binding protein n=1 Tax=Cryptosporangium aurantiacum TaxID=134849 RepID=A0A1M7MV53_9ACTN|nr:hypothetical protein [Cryptosporangium aurantiacum]SHM94905.1 hypothetical protein SAMN05443668_102284 [Cryptosporangium aurantiacum]
MLTRAAALTRGGVLAWGAAWLVAVAIVLAATPAQGGDDPVTVTGDNRRSVDITVRDDRHGRTRPRPPTAADAPEAWDDACTVPNASANLLCNVGTGSAPGGPPDDVVALAVEARSRLTIPLPTPSLRPLVRFADGASGGLTGTPTWLWINSAHWRTPLSREVRAGAVIAVVSAAPVRVTWWPGDGSRVTCRTSGTPLTDATHGPTGSPDCGHTYRRTSVDQPGGGYRTRVGVTWAVTWAGSDGSGGALAPLVVTAEVSYPVRDGRAELVAP